LSLPKIEGFYFQQRLSFGQFIRLKRGQLWQSIWDKSLVHCGIGNILGNTLRTLGLLGYYLFTTPWKLDEKSVGTHWEQQAKPKNSSTRPLQPPPKENTPEPLGCMLLGLNSLAEFLSRHLFVTIFNLDQAQGVGTCNWGDIWPALH
jgi:hypothetical protein